MLSRDTMRHRRRWLSIDKTFNKAESVDLVISIAVNETDSFYVLKQDIFQRIKKQKNYSVDF